MTEAQKEADKTRWVVLNLSEANPQAPSYYSIEADARSFAEGRAAADKDGTYAVFQKIGTARLEPKVVWKGAVG